MDYFDCVNKFKRTADVKRNLNYASALKKKEKRVNYKFTQEILAWRASSEAFKMKEKKKTGGIMKIRIYARYFAMQQANRNHTYTSVYILLLGRRVKI